MEKKTLDAQHNDAYWMKYALKGAAMAARRDEVPVGAVLVYQGQVIAKAYNRREEWHTPLGHAELICLHRASQKLKKWRLSEATLYVTLEPCVMCSGALVQARIGRLVFGAYDPKGGAAHSLYQICHDSRLNHRMEVVGGVLEQECSEELKIFFRKKRQQKKET